MISDITFRCSGGYYDTKSPAPGSSTIPPPTQPPLSVLPPPPHFAAPAVGLEPPGPIFLHSNESPGQLSPHRDEPPLHLLDLGPPPRGGNVQQHGDGAETRYRIPSFLDFTAVYTYFDPKIIFIPLRPFLNIIFFLPLATRHFFTPIVPFLA